MEKKIMVQGTMSGAGKSLIAAGLCRIFAQDGYRVAPFKAQNMSLNSYITEEGLEMGRAQVMQAEAARIKPLACMNPVLLKPTSDTGSQVIVNGEVVGNMSAREYFEYKKGLEGEIRKAYDRLAKMSDIVVIEGAGSPAEINLKDNDIVNMGLAKMLDAPVLLVGDIDRGGVFAQLIGTLLLLEDDERDMVKGLVINKFRGDKSLLDPGIDMLTEKTGKPFVGAVPWANVRLEDEDSITERFNIRQKGSLDIAVIRFPRISNFTDLDVFEQNKNVSVRYVTNRRDIGDPDLIVLPGSKNTIGDLKWLRECGLDDEIIRRAKDIPVFGICGGFQMLGEMISDPYHIEDGGEERGLSLLPVSTVIEEEKTRRQRTETVGGLEGVFSCLNGITAEGYEIHMGVTGGGVSGAEDDGNFAAKDDGNFAAKEAGLSKMIISHGNVYGTYLHGVFDAEGIAPAILKALADRRGMSIETGGMLSYPEYKEQQYDMLADVMRKSMNMEYIYSIIR